MKISPPVISGLIGRRILINYRIKADVLSRLLPPPFRVKSVAGWGLAGVCLIRLERIHPRALPAALGVRSENAAHRIAVEWEGPHGTQEGVFIPRRDTNSRFNQLVGGRLFPGLYQLAAFHTVETDHRFKIEIVSNEGERLLRLAARTSDTWPSGSLFPDLNAATDFIRRGSCGWSPNGRGKFDGLKFCAKDWRGKPLFIERIESVYFDDRARLPAGSIEFDSALVMRDIEHEWRTLPLLDQAKATL